MKDKLLEYPIGIGIRKVSPKFIYASLCYLNLDKASKNDTHTMSTGANKSKWTPALIIR